MQITCANCKTNYSLTAEQISSLSYSILPCKQCSKFIKITTCPHCQSFYSITFTSTQQTKYSLTCERCAKPFSIEFPLIREPKVGREGVAATRNNTTAPLSIHSSAPSFERTDQHAPTGDIQAVRTIRSIGPSGCHPEK